MNSIAGIAVLDDFPRHCLPLEILVSFEEFPESELSEGRLVQGPSRRGLGCTLLCADLDDAIGEDGGSSSSVGDPGSGAVA